MTCIEIDISPFCYLPLTFMVIIINKVKNDQKMCLHTAHMVSSMCPEDVWLDLRHEQHVFNPLIRNKTFVWSGLCINITEILK